jgi:hypothetical protein
LRPASSLNEFPAGAVLAAEEVGGVFGVGELELFWIPEEGTAGEFFAEVGAKGDVAEEDDFGEGAGPIEVGAAGCAVFAGFDPFFVMADGAGQVLGGWP